MQRSILNLICRPFPRVRPCPGIWLMLAAAACCGCGTTREKLATEQLLLSDAVDRAVAHIDFSPLSGETVYLDTTYVRQIKGNLVVNADYIISSLRQQMVLAGCLLQDNREQATYIAEARVGVLGSDAHDVNYGIPGSQGLSAAATLVTSAAPLPAFPEISLARKTDDTAATKVAVFAFHRETREPVWQSGLSVARSSAHAKWIFGAGPFQSGSIYEGTQFAGDRLKSTTLKGEAREVTEPEDMAYRHPAVWDEALQNKLRDGPPTSSPQLAAQTATTQAPDEFPREERAQEASDPNRGEGVEPASYAEDASGGGKLGS